MHERAPRPEIPDKSTFITNLGDTILVVDGLDEDLHPRDQFVVSLLPILSSTVAHVLVASRPYPDLQDKLPPGHPLADCHPVELQPFEGSAELADQAKAEIDSLVQESEDDYLALDILGLLTAAGGPLAIDDLTALHTGRDRPQPKDTFVVRRLVADRAARSLEPVGSADQPRYRFAHNSLLQHALANPDLTDPSYRDRIHTFAHRWHDQSWPPPGSPQHGTPLYLLDTYPATLAGDPDHLGLFPAQPDRLAALGGDVDWVITALEALGVSRVLSTLATASTLAPADPGVAGLLVTVGAAARHLSEPDPLSQPADILRQLCLHATEYRLEDLAAQLRERLANQPDPGLIPVWTPRVRPLPAVELGAHSGAVRAIGVLPDGRIVTGGDDRRLRMWDPHQPAQPSELGTHHRSVRAVAVLHDGRLVTGGADGRVVIWNPHHPDQPVELGAHSDPVEAVGELPDGRVVSAGEDRWVEIWEPQQLGHPLDLGAHASEVRAVGVLADGRVVTGGADQWVRIWDPDDPGDFVRLGTHEGEVDAVGVLADGRVVTGGADNRVRIWDPQHPDHPLELGAHDHGVTAIGLLTDGRVVTGAGDGQVWMWDPQHADHPLALGAHDGTVGAIATLPNQHVVTGGSDGRVRIWDPRQPDHPLQPGMHDGAVRAVSVLADGRVVTGSWDGRVLIWNPDAPGDLTQVAVHEGAVRAVAVLPDGRVVSGGVDGRVLIVDPEQPGQLLQVAAADDTGVTAVGVLPDGRMVTGSWDGRIRIWDQPGRPLDLGNHKPWPEALGVLPDGRVVSGGTDARLLLWSPDQPGHPVGLGAHKPGLGGIDAVGVLSDGRVVSGGRDGQVLVWDPDEPGHPSDLGFHHGWVHAIAVLADDRVVSSGTDRRLFIWDLERSLQATSQLATPAEALGVGPPGSAGGQRLAIAAPLSVWEISDHHD